MNTLFCSLSIPFLQRDIGSFLESPLLTPLLPCKKVEVSFIGNDSFNKPVFNVYLDTDFVFLHDRNKEKELIKDIGSRVFVHEGFTYIDIEKAWYDADRIGSESDKANIDACIKDFAKKQLTPFVFVFPRHDNKTELVKFESSRLSRALEESRPAFLDHLSSLGFPYNVT